MRVRGFPGFPGGVYPQAAATVAALGGDTPDSELRFTLLQVRSDYRHLQASSACRFRPCPRRLRRRRASHSCPTSRAAARKFTVSAIAASSIFSSTADLRGNGIVLRPPLEAQGILGMSGSFDLSLKIHETAAAATEHILLGTAGGTRLAIQGLGVNWFRERHAREARFRRRRADRRTAPRDQGR